MDREIYPGMGKTIDDIKNLAASYQKHYGFVFDISVSKSERFRRFMGNSRGQILLALKEAGEPTYYTYEGILELLFENFDSRLHKTQTGFTVLKELFYIMFSRAIEDYMYYHDGEAYVSTIEDRELFSLFDEYDFDFRNGSNLRKWYRGQSNFDWNLLPSIYRNIDGKKLVRLTRDSIFKLYQQFGLIEKYGRTIGFHSINYDFQSFMQHAVSLSPLLDFSTNPIVSTVMALSDTTTFKQHYGKDSSLYELIIKDEKIISDKELVDSALRNFNAYYCETIPFMETLFLKNREITIDSIGSLIQALSPSLMFIDIPSNDRMKYQSGKFVLFHDCLILNDKVYAELCEHAYLRIYRINKSMKAHVPGKANLLERIVKKYPEYSPSNMMNPYDYFSE